VDDVLVGDYPTALAADARYVYVANAGAATVSSIDPRTRTVYDVFGLSRATDLVAGDGHLWAANGGAPGHTPLGVGPGTLLDWGPGPTLKTWRVGPSMNGSEQQTTLAADRSGYSIWAGNENSRTVREIDRSVGKTLRTIHGVAPGGLAAVGNSSIGDTVWASDTGRNVVVRIDGNAGHIVHRISVPGAPTRIAADAGAVWVVTSGKHGLVRIDPRSNRVVARIPLPITPKRVALGAGSVWVTGYRWSDHLRSSRGGTVLRIDPRTNRIVDRIVLGDVAADGVVVSHGLVWVGVAPSA
jgi:DNA-binding beta-propeller fold protein YncE